VIDVFGERVFTATENVKIHEGKIRSSCKEIKETWATIKRKPVDGAHGDQGELGLS
jgi:hypothetical protein